MIPQPQQQDQPERLAVVAVVLLVTVGNFASAMLAALLVVVCIGGLR